jgi:hypothetical protein
MSKILQNKFIEIYGQYAARGYARDIIVFKTMYKLQEMIIKYMLEKPDEINIIAAAFEQIKHDPNLHERAVIAYDLTKCDDKIKAKYMSLVNA